MIHLAFSCHSSGSSKYHRVKEPYSNNDNNDSGDGDGDADETNNDNDDDDDDEQVKTSDVECVSHKETRC